MAVQGIVSILNDPISGAVIGPQWTQDLATLSPALNHLTIRASISVDNNNHVNIKSVQTSLQAYKDAGFPVWLVLHGGLENHYQSLTGNDYLAAMPNAKLGLNGDMMMNDYINRFSLTAVGTLQALGDLCPDTVFIWNEANLDGPSLVTGAKPVKNQSLSPQVFGALLGTTAKRIAASCPNVKTILPGSLSCLVKFNTDPSGPWVGGYLKTALTYINTYGMVAPYPFSGLSLNLEGIIDDKYATWCAQAVTNLVKSFNIGGQAVIGEWGLANSSIKGADMTPTFTALSKHFGTIFLYCHNTQVPNDLNSYGTTLSTINPQGVIVPNGHTAFYSIATTLFASPYANPDAPAIAGA